MAFNRTSLGLKHDIAIITVNVSVPFNRTSLGLKHDIAIITVNVSVPFNRTSLGLKLNLYGVLFREDFLLLIEPVWD